MGDHWPRAVTIASSLDSGCGLMRTGWLQWHLCQVRSFKTHLKWIYGTFRGSIGLKWLPQKRIQRENSFTARNGSPMWPEDCFLSPFVQSRRETAHLVLTAKPRSSHVSWAQGWNPPTSPCPTLSPSTEPKSQGHCWKWHHKLKVVWRLSCIIG